MTMPLHIEPMLANLGALPKDWENWGYEFKWDGIRAIMYWDGSKVRIESRNLIDITFRYPELSNLGKRLHKNAIVDGEIIALDKKGRPSFSILQQRMLISENKFTKSLMNIKIQYYIFDILFFNNKNLMSQTYENRRNILESLNIDHPFCKVPPSFRGKGQIILSVAKQHGLEGVVCKKLRSVYTTNKRSTDWLKVKIIKSDEFKICGFKYVKNNKSRIGSLQLGAYDKNKNLTFVGGVGTGFGATDHKILLSKLEENIINKNPFDEKMEKDVVFVKPKYVAEVEYRRWPENNILQQASYKGLRLDKSPDEIVLTNRRLIYANPRVSDLKIHLPL
jgi:bifunctional non-homologous end joining protein LigD